MPKTMLLSIGQAELELYNTVLHQCSKILEII